MDNKLHVLILPSWYPESANDIGGSFFREQAHSIKRMGVKVGVLSVNLRSFKKIFTKGNKHRVEDDLGVLTLRKSGVNWLPRIRNGSSKLYATAGLKAFSEYVKVNGKPDVIHVHSVLNAGVIAYEINKKYGIPFCITEHSSSYARDLFKPWQTEVIKEVVSRSSFNIAVSESFSAFLEKKFPTTKWTYIPNILPPQFQSVTVRANDRNDFVFFNVSILTKNKGINTLIRAFSDGFKHKENVFLHIIGDGKEKEFLEILAKDLGVGNKVKFLGAKPRNEIVSYFEQVDSYVLSSHFETFGVSLIEALSFGLPSVATICGGPESILKEDVNGHFCEVNDVESMATAMLNIYENYQCFDRKFISLDCKNRFGEATVVQKIIDTYIEVLNW